MLYEITTPSIGLSLLGGSATLTLILFVLYQFFLHPLRKFRGPRVAAVSRWYEFYHDVIRDGTYVKYYPVLHKRYGPVVRIGPNHVHVDDPEFYREVFKSQTTYRKAPYFYENLGISESLVGICDPLKHRLHRAVVNPLFSKQSLDRLLPIVQDIVEHAANVMRQRHELHKATDIQKLYRCITVDVISTSLFGHTQDLTTQDENDIYPPFLTSVDMFTNHMWLTKHFSFLNKIALNLPPNLAEKLAPGYQSFRKQCESWIRDVIARREKGILQTEDGRDTVFDLLLEPQPDRGYKARPMEDLVDEAFLLLVAGSDTTAYSIACTTYYILTHKQVLGKLKQELESVERLENGRLDCKNIMSLPYLTGVVKEGLRISSGIPGILPRVVPKGGATVQGQFIPEGSIVSISTRIIHDNPSLFPEPQRFKPERWLGDTGKELEKWNVSFSKGPRQCIGINLAYLEIYVTLAIFFADFDLTLFETNEQSMEWLDHGVASNKANVKVHAIPLSVA